MTEPLATPQNAQRTSTPQADRLGPIAQAVLRGAAKGLCCDQGGFQVAELWLIDEASRAVTLAARWTRAGSSAALRNSPTERLLAKAPADVAALAGGAVVLESREDAQAWPLHHDDVAAAICLPVSSDTAIHGIMWLFADSAVTIPDETVELAEIVAGRLALEVEKASAQSGADQESHRRSDDNDPESQAGRADGFEQAERIPQFAAVPPIETAAWTSSHAAGLAGARCWELPKGRLAAMAVAAIDSPESTAVSQRAAVEWVLAEAQTLAPKAADAGILLTLLNRRLLESPLAGEGLAVTAALIDAPEDAEAGIGGVGTWAFAGPTVNLSVRASSISTHAGDLVPLGWSEHEAAYAARPFELAIRERLVLTAGDPRLTSPLIERRIGDIYRAATSDAHREMTPEGCLRRLAAGGCDDVLAAVALRRV